MSDPLPLVPVHRTALAREDFVVSASNRAAYEAATGTGEISRRFALSGPAGAGKTHLATVWADAREALHLPAIDLTDRVVAGLGELPAVVIEDADGLAELDGPVRRQIEALLFHALNLTAAEGVALLVTGRTAPARWAVETRDLASRLAALPHVAIEPPDDALLARILSKLFTDRQLSVAEDVIAFLVRRMERSFEAAEAVVGRLDRLALENHRNISRPFVVELYEHVPGILEKAPPA